MCASSAQCVVVGAACGASTLMLSHFEHPRIPAGLVAAQGEGQDGLHHAAHARADALRGLAKGGDGLHLRPADGRARGGPAHLHRRACEAGQGAGHRRARQEAQPAPVHAGRVQVRVQLRLIARTPAPSPPVVGGLSRRKAATLQLSVGVCVRLPNTGFGQSCVGVTLCSPTDRGEAAQCEKRAVAAIGAERCERCRGGGRKRRGCLRWPAAAAVAAAGGSAGGRW
eukprot:scaffold188_cov107-Isochrysis_galbana.AAC.5